MPDIYLAGKEKDKSERFLAKPEVDSGGKGELEQAKTHHTASPLAAYAESPKKVHFETQDPREKIILLLRRHWITNLPWIGMAFLLLLAPLVLIFFPPIVFLPLRFQLMAVVVWYLITFAFILEEFLGWLFNVYIVTDERIVDIDFHNLIYKEISDAKIDRIQDVTYTMGGVARSLFNFGDVLVQTAAERPQFEFDAVPHPDRVTRVLNELREEEEQEKLEGRTR